MFTLGKICRRVRANLYELHDRSKLLRITLVKSNGLGINSSCRARGFPFRFHRGFPFRLPWSQFSSHAMMVTTGRGLMENDVFHPNSFHEHNPCNRSVLPLQEGGGTRDVYPCIAM